MIRAIFARTRHRKAAPDRRPGSEHTRVHVGSPEVNSSTLVPEEMFRRVLSLERKRSERSRQRFVLMLLHIGQPSAS